MDPKDPDFEQLIANLLSRLEPIPQHLIADNMLSTPVFNHLNDDVPVNPDAQLPDKSNKKLTKNRKKAVKTTVESKEKVNRSKIIREEQEQNELKFKEHIEVDENASGFKTYTCRICKVYFLIYLFKVGLPFFPYPHFIYSLILILKISFALLCWD